MILPPDVHPDALPAGSIVLHIGPPKTATTQLQASLYAARPTLLEHGVRHAGASRHPGGAVKAVLGTPSAFAGGIVPGIGRWKALVQEARTAPQSRVIISSEFFADAPPEVIRRIADDIGRDRVHVAVTLRPLARILPSQWMQYVCDGSVVAWDDWLRAMFGRNDRRITPGFWRRHRHHELVERWATELGRDRVTVLAIREGDRGGVLRDAEGLLGLPGGLLEEHEGVSNRSLTWPEAEAVREFNSIVRAGGLSRVELHRVVHYGASRYLKDQPPDPAAPRIELPDWVLDDVRAEAAANVDNLRASGVRIAGDLDGLASVPDPRGADLPQPGGDPSVAATFAVGVLIATGMARPGPAETRQDMSMIATYALRGYIMRRAVSSLRRRKRLVRVLRPLRRGSRVVRGKGGRKARQTA